MRVMKELMDVGNIYICMQNVPGEPYRGVASDQPLSDLAFALEEENPMIQWLKEHDHELTERIRKRHDTTSPCETSGNSQIRRRSTKTWYSDCHRPYHPTGNVTTADADL